MFKKMSLTIVLTLIPLSIIFPVSGFADNDIRFIVNKSVGESVFRATDLGKIFLGIERRWPNKNKIQLVVQPDSEAHPILLETFVRKNTAQYKAYWRNRMFTGKGGLPEYVKTTEDMINFVDKNEGAIGYIPSNYKLSDKRNIQIITITE